MPGWAAAKTVDDVSGSRWCLLDCRLRERTVTSEQAAKETAQVYEQALRRDGWQPWKVSRCPEQQATGSYTCWRRDELTLDLWVRDADLRAAAGGRRAGGRAAPATRRPLRPSAPARWCR